MLQGEEKLAVLAARKDFMQLWILNLLARKAAIETAYGYLVLPVSLQSQSGSKSFQAISKKMHAKRQNT